MMTILLGWLWSFRSFWQHLRIFWKLPLYLAHNHPLHNKALTCLIAHHIQQGKNSPPINPNIRILLFFELCCNIIQISLHVDGVFSLFYSLVSFGNYPLLYFSDLFRYHIDMETEVVEHFLFLHMDLLHFEFTFTRHWGSWTLLNFLGWLGWYFLLLVFGFLNNHDRLSH